jgi:hypothetical protein
MTRILTAGIFPIKYLEQVEFIFDIKYEILNILHSGDPPRSLKKLKP